MWAVTPHSQLCAESVATGAILSEEELAAMSPTAAAVAKIVKPGMKLTEVRTSASRAQSAGQSCVI